VVAPLDVLEDQHEEPLARRPATRDRSTTAHRARPVHRAVGRAGSDMAICFVGFC
jgi:hypothetical protein